MSGTEADGRMPATVGEILERLRVFRGRDVSVSSLSGGHMNATYLATVDDEKYVVRVSGRDRSIFTSDETTERYNVSAAASVGAAPRIVEALSDFRVTVVEYLDGDVLSPETLGTPGQVPRLAAALRKLHSAPRFLNDVDWFVTTRGWIRECEARHVRVPEGLRERKEALEHAAAALARHPMPTAPCHNDLTADNMVDDGRRIRFIDFEYSGNNDPCYDVGDVAFQSELDDDWRAKLCEAYFGRADPFLLARMTLHSMLGAAAWSVWAALQATLSTLDIDYQEISAAYEQDVVGIADSEDFPRLLRHASA